MAEKEYIITLVRSAQGGDSASFAELYNLYYQKVFAFIRTIVRNSADAEDILQLTFTVQPVLPKGLCLHPHDCTKQRGCGGHFAAHLSERLAKP